MCHPVERSHSRACPRSSTPQCVQPLGFGIPYSLGITAASSRWLGGGADHYQSHLLPLIIRHHPGATRTTLAGYPRVELGTFGVTIRCAAYCASSQSAWSSEPSSRARASNQPDAIALTLTRLSSPYRCCTQFGSHPGCPVPIDRRTLERLRIHSEKSQGLVEAVRRPADEAQCHCDEYHHQQNGAALATLSCHFHSPICTSGTSPPNREPKKLPTPRRIAASPSIVSAMTNTVATINTQ